MNEDELIMTVNEIISSQKDLEPEIVDIVNKHFWELL